MSIAEAIRRIFGKKELPPHLIRGRKGEEAARRHLERAGLKTLVLNFRGKEGEIDLVMKDEECLVFVEVKTRSIGQWTRPSRAVDARKRKLLSKAALDYLRLLGRPKVKFRFDVVEVLVEDECEVSEIRHLRNCFPLEGPFRYG